MEANGDWLTELVSDEARSWDAYASKNSIFVDIVQIEVDLPPSYPIFDKFIFDKVLIMLTSLPPLEFLTKIMKF